MIKIFQMIFETLTKSMYAQISPMLMRNWYSYGKTFVTTSKDFETFNNREFYNI